MLTKKEAINIGINACIDIIGRSFVQKYESSSSSAYGDMGDDVYCFVGVNDQPEDFLDGEDVILDSKNKFPYTASCKIDLTDGNITFLECTLPR